MFSADEIECLLSLGRFAAEATGEVIACTLGVCFLHWFMFASGSEEVRLYGGDE